MVLLVVVFYGHKRRLSLMRDFAESLLWEQALSPGYSRHFRLYPAVMMVAGLLFMFVAWAGPRAGYKWEKVTQAGVEIVIAIDCSRSMMAEDIPPYRLKRAKREILDLLDMLEGDRVGLVAFAGTAFLQCPLTLDYSGFHVFLDALSPDYLPQGGTDLAAAINTAVATFDESSDSTKAVILITDGDSTEGATDDAVEAAVKAGVQIYPIGVGTPSGIPIKNADGGYMKDGSGRIIMAKINESQLKKMAMESGGIYVRSVAGDMDLDQIYKQHIKHEITERDVHEGKRKVWIDRYQWPLFAGFLCWILACIWPALKHRQATRAICLLLLIIPILPSTARADTVHDLMASAEAHYQNGDYDKALSDYTAAQIKMPENKSILYNLGNTCYKLGQFEQAATYFKEASGSTDAERQFQSLYNLGNSYYRGEAYDESIKAYQDALKVKENDPGALANLAFVKKQKEKQQKQENQQQKNSDDNKESSDDQKDGDDKKPSEGNKSDQQNSGNNSGEPDQNKQDQGKQNPDDEASPEEQSKSRGEDDDEKGRDNDPKEGASASESDDKGADTSEKSGSLPADRILNRLEDKPGRALMPDYKKRAVEKDW